MKNMTTPEPSMLDEGAIRKQNAIRAGWIIVIFSALLVTWGVYALTQRPDTARTIFLASHIMLLLSGILSVWLSRRGRSDTAAMLLISAFLVEVCVLDVVGKGQGIIFFLLTVLIVSVISIWALSPRYRVYTITAGIVVGLFLIFFDLFSSAPWRQEAVSESVTPIVGGIVGIIYIIILGIQFRSFSLRAKLITAFLAAAIIPLIILAFFNDRNTRSALTDAANQSLLSAAEQTALQLDTFVNNNLDTIRTQANLPEIRDYIALPASQRSYRQDEIVSFLSAFARENPIYITSVAVYDRNGYTLMDTYTDDIGVDKSDRSWFQQALSTGLPYASDLEFSQTNSEASIYFSAPVRNAAGNIIGVIRTRYNAAILQDIIISNNNLLGQGSFAILMDGESHVRLAHGTTPSIIFKSVVPLDSETIRILQARRLLPPGTAKELSTNLPEFESALENYEVQPFFLTELRIGDNTLEQGAITTMKTQEWHVIYAQDQETFLSPVNEQARANVTLAIIISLVVAGFAVLISTTLSGPIVRLTQTAEAIAGGNINIQARVESRDEIGTLAQTFNRMTQQLREFIATLEQRVADRTRALATTSEVSRRLSTILNRKELVTEVVNQVRGAFGYYHTQIYFFDEAHENLVMAGGTGEVGRMMLAQFHKLAKGRGLVGRAADSNKPVLVSDTSQNTEWLPNPLLPDTKSEVAIPIAIGDEVLGVMDIQHNIANGLQQDDIDSLQSIANQVAIAYQNIRQYENSQKVANDLNVVANVGIATATIIDIDRLLQEVVDLSKKSFNLYHAHIYLVNETGDTLELAAGAGDVGRQMVSERRHIPMDAVQSLVARAARTHQGVVVNDVTATPDFLPNPLLPDTRSELAVPMIVAGKVIGVLDVQSETANRFTEVDVNIKTTLASQVAVALQNARSFQQTQKQAEREAALNLITQKIQGTTSVESAMKVAARELGHALGMKQTFVSLDPTVSSDEQKGARNG
jgi:GAF domain-containing protein/HAMP domain-containing protein